MSNDPLKRLGQKLDKAESEEEMLGTDWTLVIHITGMSLAVLSFIIGAVSNIFDTTLPLFSQLIYTLSGFTCLLAMWIFWIHDQLNLFWLSIAATFLIMYGA